MANRLTKGGLTVSMIVGTLLVPVSAVLAVWLTGANDPAEAETTASASTTTLPTVPVTTTSDGVTDADIEAACGPDGMQLVDLEAEGTITDVQQAALDALRELCDQRGLSLPDKPAGEPIIRTVVIPDPPAVASAPAPATSDDQYEDDGYEHEDEYEDDEYENDDHGQYDDDHGQYEDDHEEDDD